MNEIRLVIFDYDGTLFDTRLAIVHCMSGALKQHGRTSLSHSRIEDAVGTGATLPDTLMHLDPSLRHDRTALDKLVVTYRALYRDEGTAMLRPYPGAASTLRELEMGGITCALVSNKGIDAIQRSLDETGLSPLIDFVIGEQPGMPKKPDPAVITDLIVPRYGLDRDEMLIVGDTELDILFAKRTGITSCWASYGYGTAAACRVLNPDHEIAGIDHLQKIVFESDPRRSAQAAL
jgi:phosphoglycolate phosphatase